MLKALFDDKEIRCYCIFNTPDPDYFAFAKTLWCTFRLTPIMSEKYPDIEISSEYLRNNTKYNLKEEDKEIFSRLEDAFIVKDLKSFILIMENMCEGECQAVEIVLEDRFMIKYYNMGARLGKDFYLSILESQDDTEDIYDRYVKKDCHIMYGCY